MIGCTALLLTTTYVLWLCFNAPPGSVGLEFPFDLVFYYFPMLELAAERLGAGELPLWNPYQCCGVPFLATAQVAVFYPPTWIVLFLPVGLAIQVLMFGQVFAAGLLASLFFRSLGAGVLAATLGGMMFIFGCILGQVYWPSEVSTIVWLPLLMWSAERFIQSGRWGWWALFTAGVTLQMLAGFPQFVVYSFYLLVPYVAVRLIAIHAGKPRTGGASWPVITRKSAALAAGAGIALGLAAIQLLPTLELVRNTARNDSLSPRSVHYLETQRGKYFTLPGLMANMFDPRAKMITIDFPDGSGYLGMAAPLMIGIGLLLGRRDHRVWFFLAVAVVSCALAFGYNDYSGWLYRLYSKLPTGSMFRTPSRLLLLTYFSLITLAVFGMDHFAKGLRELHGKLTLRAIIAVLAIGLLVAARIAGGADGVRLASAFILLVVAAYCAGHRPAVRWTVQICFAGLLLFDLANAVAPYGSLRDIPVEWGRRPHWAGVSPVDMDDFTSVAGTAGLERVALPGLRPTKFIQPPRRFYMVTEYEPLLPQRWRYANDAMGGEPGFIMCRIDPDKYSHFYDMAGVRHMFRTKVLDRVRERLEPRQWEIHSMSPRPTQPGVQCSLERRASALPRAYLVGRYAISRPDRALERLVAGDFDHRHGVLLETDPGFPPSSSDVKRQPARIVSYASEHVVIHAETTGPRLLVLADSNFPGWKARVNGTPVPILRANYLFRAVALPAAGTHEIIFEYRPTGFKAGLTVSALSLVVFIGVVITAWRRQRGASARPPAPSTKL